MVCRASGLNSVNVNVNSQTCWWQIMWTEALSPKHNVDHSTTAWNFIKLPITWCRLLLMASDALYSNVILLLYPPIKNANGYHRPLFQLSCKSSKYAFLAATVLASKSVCWSQVPKPFGGLLITGRQNLPWYFALWQNENCRNLHVEV